MPILHFFILQPRLRGAVPGGVEDYIIWNEPNNWPGGQPPPDLDAEHFAGLLYHCWKTMTPQVRLYWGGIFMNLTSGYPPPYTNKPDEGNLRYIDDVYRTLRDTWGLCGGEKPSWPWTGVNLHIHRDRDQGFINDLFDGEDLYPGLHGIKKTRLEYGDSSELIVGEWGVSVEDWRDKPPGPDPLSHVYGLLKDRADVMFFHSHHAIKQGSTTWGIHYYKLQQDEFVLTGFTDEDPPPPPRYNPDMEGLHGAYNELMGT